MFFNSVKLSKEYDIPKLFPILYKIMSFFALRQIKRSKIQMDFRPYFVHPMRIELISSEPESGILSIELRVHHQNAVQKYK